MFILILFAVLGLIGFSSWFIANKIYKGLQKGNNSYAALWGVLSFVLCFALLAAGIFFLIISNVMIGR